MGVFLRIAAYLLHPLLMPFLGALTYYLITPRFIDREIVYTKLFAVLIITFFVPVIFFFLLKNLKLVESIHLKEVKERKVPLMIQSVLLLLIIKLVYNPYDNPELYYFFVGVLFSAMTALLMVFFNFKISLHQMGIAGVTMFLVALSIHFQVNMLLWIGLFLFFNGWLATSRLYTYSHTYPELFAGLFIGIIPQMLVLNFWL